MSVVWPTRPDGTTILSGSADKNCQTVEVSSGKLLHTLSFSGFVGPVAYAPDGKTVLVGDSGDKNCQAVGGQQRSTPAHASAW